MYDWKTFLLQKAHKLKNKFYVSWRFGQSFFKLINKKGVINIGGKSQSVYEFAKKYNKDIKKSQKTVRTT